MKVASLSGSRRESVGKKSTKQLRAQGLVPCVVYGNGEQIHFAAKENDVNKIIYSPDVYKVEIDVDGKKTFAIVQDLQQDPVTDKIRHIDFLRLDDKKPVKVGLPIKLVGNSRGVMNGGKLTTQFRKLAVVGLPNDLPDFIEINISDLKIGDAIRINQLDNQKLHFLAPQNAVVVAVRMSRKAVIDKTADAEADAKK